MLDRYLWRLLDIDSCAYRLHLVLLSGLLVLNYKQSPHLLVPKEKVAKRMKSKSVRKTLALV